MSINTTHFEAKMPRDTKSTGPYMWFKSQSSIAKAFFHLYFLARHLTITLKGLFAPLFTPEGCQALKAQVKDLSHTNQTSKRPTDLLKLAKHCIFFHDFLKD